MKPYAFQKKILPEYPRTLHLPHKPNADRTDVVATPEDAKVIFERPTCVQEKIDGSNCGMALVDGEAIIRNREFILAKGFNNRKDTPAKQQFATVFTWFYENKKRFEKLNKIIPNCSVFGEWMIAQHGLEYDLLPDWFVPYDLYDYETEHFINPVTATQALTEAGFVPVPLVYQGIIKSYDDLEALCNAPSPFTTKGNREGVYLKVSDEWNVTHRFKMVRADFVRGALWSDEKITKNKLA